MDRSEAVKSALIDDIHIVEKSAFFQALFTLGNIIEKRPVDEVVQIGLIGLIGLPFGKDPHAGKFFTGTGYTPYRSLNGFGILKFRRSQQRREQQKQKLFFYHFGKNLQ